MSWTIGIKPWKSIKKSLMSRFPSRESLKMLIRNLGSLADMSVWASARWQDTAIIKIMIGRLNFTSGAFKLILGSVVLDNHGHYAFDIPLRGYL
jgi:hypothetical protein